MGVGACLPCSAPQRAANPEEDLLSLASLFDDPAVLSSSTKDRLLQALQEHERVCISRSHASIPESVQLNFRIDLVKNISKVCIPSIVQL